LLFLNETMEQLDREKLRDKFKKEYPQPEDRNITTLYTDWLEEQVFQQEWISVKDALPPLAPENECVNGLPYSETVLVKNELGKTMEAMYEYMERDWLDPEFERNVEYTHNEDGEVDNDCRITHWQPLPSPLSKSITKS
jgi:hypothetical protein